MTPRDAKQAPTEVGALPVMTAAEFRCLREWLGLTTAWVADRLGVAERSVQRWEHGHAPVPDGVAAQLLAWSEDTYQVLNAAVDALMDVPGPAMWTYRTEADYRRWEPDGQWPAGWHRMVAARVADEVPGLRLLYRGVLPHFGSESQPGA